jgi:diaminohydroxyphosphoribosylaminopyrimidine deaminase / 5-amino-6-(5-phosphoribosylamino)uracil reductase
MLRCLELASRGRGKVSPNPMVGCVIVHKDRIIGEGWHREFGGDHAEVNAIRTVKNKKLLSESTLYVNLEPCSHFGKTPPCTDLILKEKIPKVVIACIDTNPEVSGKGVKKLEDQGIVVIQKVLDSKSRSLNRSYFTQSEKNRPYIILKWAQSADGFITDRSGTPIKISNELSDRIVHKWRSEVDGILIGANTLKNDDPKLTTRLWSGKSPRRIILSGGGNLPEKARAFEDGNYLILTEKGNEKFNPDQLIEIEKNNLGKAVKELLKKGVQNILIEGGAETIQSFLEENLWDECLIIIGEMKLIEGKKGPLAPEKQKKINNVRNNQLFVFLNSDEN